MHDESLDIQHVDELPQAGGAVGQDAGELPTLVMRDNVEEGASDESPLAYEPGDTPVGANPPDETAAYISALAASDQALATERIAESVSAPETVVESSGDADEEPEAVPADEGSLPEEVASDEPDDLPSPSEHEHVEEHEEEPQEAFVEAGADTEEPATAADVADVPEVADEAEDVDEPSAMYEITSEPSPFVVLRQDEMSFYHDRADEDWEQAAPGAHRFVPGGQRRLQEDIEHQAGPPMLIVAGVAVAIMVIACLLLFHLLGLSNTPETSDTTQIVGTVVSKKDAEEIIASLDGWWKTDRALDGRYWHIEKKSVQTYAADGKLASENMLDVTKVERMTTGPGDIDKPGYYLRDVGFYLADDDPDTLYALAADGSADADANLLRTEEPTFQSEEKKEKEEEPEANEADFVLPESATRVYDYTELDAMDDYDLYIARYEIVARHGCIFKEGGELEAYFTQKSWYQPNEYYSEYDLSDVETQNLEVIRSVEYNHNSPYQWS